MKLTQQDQKRVNDVLRARDIAHDQVKHINCIRIHPTETWAHLKGKVEYCHRLYKERKPFLTEVWTADHKQRFDILDILDNNNIEIETGKSKNKLYKGDEVIFV